MIRTPYYIYIAAALALTACTNDDLTSTNNGSGKDVITLSAGMAQDATTRAITRADDGHDAGANGGGHLALAEDIKASLQVSGKWGSNDIIKTTTATMGAETETDSKHNEVKTEPLLFWDDYGTADPVNKETGRTQGLTIYGVAVNKAGTVTGAPTLEASSVGGSISWTLAANQSAGWDAKDLLISNNVKGDNAYKFDNKADGKLLEFQHAMSKVTINLTAGKGFVDSKFVNEPTVSLLGFPISGTVNVTNGALTEVGTGIEITKTHLASPESWTASCSGFVTRDAIVFPTRTLAATDVIAKINADDNIYEVTAAKLVEKMGSDLSMLSGTEYILNITVNKTGIEVTATVKDWVKVEAVTEEPVINVTANIGGTATEKKDGFSSFDFYLSDAAKENAATLYSKATTANAPDGENPADGSKQWTFTTKQYWPSHNTHYFMRGVFPTETAVTEGKISVTSGDYSASSFPSNLLVGAPEFTESNKMCNNSDHDAVDMSTSGICAREGKINLHFNYMMSQVEVRLTTPTSGTNVVNLSGAKVEIINGYTAGNVDIHTKTVATTGEIKDFEVKHIESEDNNYRHSIIVPQSLTSGEGESAKDLQFKITITNSDNTTDVYFATIKDIKVKEGSADAALITAWESGKHYIYTLDMRKTEVKVSATLADWTEATADQDIWF